MKAYHIVTNGETSPKFDGFIKAMNFGQVMFKLPKKVNPADICKAEELCDGIVRVSK